MYKQAIINSLVSLADVASEIDSPAAEEQQLNAGRIPKYDIKNVPLTEYKPIELSPNKNEAAYSLRNAMQRGSGAELDKLRTYKVNDLLSATDVKNMVRFNPNNTPIAVHEYGHVIDKPSLGGMTALDWLHPAIGDFYRYRQELDANKKGIAAFRKGVAHNKELGDEMDKAHALVRDKALATYRSVIRPRRWASIGGSVLGGLAGYARGGEDVDSINRTINTLGGAWLGGQLGGFAGTLAAIPGNTKATKDFISALKSKEYKNAVNSVNRHLVDDARANNYYLPYDKPIPAAVNS